MGSEYEVSFFSYFELHLSVLTKLIHYRFKLRQFLTAILLPLINFYLFNYTSLTHTHLLVLYWWRRQHELQRPDIISTFIKFHIRQQFLLRPQRTGQFLSALALTVLALHSEQLLEALHHSLLVFTVCVYISQFFPKGNYSPADNITAQITLDSLA